MKNMTAEKLQRRIKEWRESPDLWDIDQDMSAMRALFEHYCERLESMDAPDREFITDCFGFLSELGKLQEREARIRNTNALTAREVLHLQERIKRAAMFVPPDDRQRYLAFLVSDEVLGDGEVPQLTQGDY
jgi:hypothetical protein